MKIDTNDLPIHLQHEIDLKGWAKRVVAAMVDAGGVVDKARATLGCSRMRLLRWLPEVEQVAGPGKLPRVPRGWPKGRKRGTAERENKAV